MDIEEAARYYPDVERVFLENGDAFVLSADRFNSVQPHLLFIGTLHAQPGCKLYGDLIIRPG